MPAICQNELERRLGLRTVDDRELSFVFSGIIPQAQYTSETRVDYPGAHAPAAFPGVQQGRSSLCYRPRRGINSGTRRTDRVRSHQQAARTATTYGLRIPLFAHVPTEGYWRYKDKLVTCRAPDAAPRNFFLMAPHPVILEVSFSGASDGFIRNIRAMGEP